MKIFATPVGETGGDALSMTLNLGYAVSTAIFLAFFLVTLVAQVKSSHYHPTIYWLVVVATTTVGTTASDMFDRTLGLGYVRSSAIELGLVVAVLVAWHLSTGEIGVDRITTRKNELFYWITILVSNTLGTALGDFLATDAGLGFQRGRPTSSPARSGPPSATPSPSPTPTAGSPSAASRRRWCSAWRWWSSSPPPRFAGGRRTPTREPPTSGGAPQRRNEPGA